MNHDEYKEQLSALLDGELGEETRAEVLTHLETCEACQQYFAELNAMRDALGDIEEIDVPAGFARGVMLRLRAEEAAKPAEPVYTEAEVNRVVARARQSVWNRRLAVSLTAAAAVLLVVAVPRFLGMGGSAPAGGATSSSVQYSTFATASTADSAAPESTEELFEANLTMDARAGGGSETAAAVAEDFDESTVYGAAAPEAAYGTANTAAASLAEPAERKTADGGAGHIDVTLSGEGAAEYLLANGAEPGEFEGEYVVDASVLRDLPDGLTLGGAQAELVAELDGAAVSVRVAETEAAP